MKIKFIIGILTLAFAIGCTAKKVVIQPKIETQEAIIDLPLEDKLVITSEVLAEGKSLYGMNCAKCHELFDAKSFSAEEWKPIVLRMQKQAKISDEQREKIYAYLTTPQM